MAGGRVWGEGARARVSACAYHNMCYTNDKIKRVVPVRPSITPYKRRGNRRPRARGVKKGVGEKKGLDKGKSFGKGCISLEEDLIKAYSTLESIP